MIAISQSFDNLLGYIFNLNISLTFRTKHDS
jgi:hypothetical protein